MITISLDEQGVFEHGSDQNDGIIMIGGIIYDDKGDPDDAEREKTRIKEYFTEVCDCFKAPYPRALHFGGGWSNKFVASVKGEYSRTLGEFLKNGTYKGKKVPSDDGKERTGEYYTFALIKSPKGKPELSSEDVSNLIKEDYASNLYMHMVEDVISRILFYNNHFLDEESVSLDLATRIYKGEVGEDVSEHTSLGYDELHAKDGDIVYLTNSDVFRTALAREMLYETENDILIKNLEARSINYFKSEPGLEFLFLSDAICTCIGFKNAYDQESYIAKSWDRMAKLTGDNRLLFLYDAVDTGFTKAWKYTDAGNIYKALSVFYDCTNKNTKEARFYKKQWEEVFINHIIRRVDTSSFSMAVRQFSQSIKNNNLKPNKLVFIYEALVSLKNSISFSNAQDNAVLYDLFDAGAATYNHVGNSDKAQECIEMCKQYVKYVGVERELRNRNKYVVSLCDSLEFERATEIAKETYEYYKRIFEIQKNIYGNDNANVHDYGIINSQLGQCYAYLNDSEAEKYFNDALGLFDKGTPDYYQTESYLLHYYIQVGNKEKYVAFANEFFGGKDDAMEQLEYIVNEGLKKSDPLISVRFALFVFIKGVYRFFLDELSDELADKIIHFETTLKAIDRRVEEHFGGYPWVLIYKYLSLISAVKNNEMSKDYLKKVKIAPGSAGIMDLMKQLAIYNIAVAIEAKALIEESAKRTIDAYNQLTEGKIAKDINDINSEITFIYC
jgi:hypothetical protein